MSAPQFSGETNPDLLNQQGIQAMECADWVTAERIYQALELLFPGQHQARLSLSLFNLGRYQEALPLLSGMIERGATDVSCIMAYAACLERTGEEDHAIRVHESLYQAFPNEDFAIRLASALIRMGQHRLLDKRLPELLAAHPNNPQILSTMSEHAFKTGDYARGFDLMHYRWSTALESPKAATLPCPAWDGHAFDGELLVTAEQGLGDEILASSVFETLVALKQRCLIDCDPRLLPIFKRSFPTLDFFDRHSNALEMAATRTACKKIEAVELGRFFRRDYQAFPPRTHWLVADKSRSALIRQALKHQFPGKQLIGLSWRSHREFLGNSKSIPIGELAALATLPNTVLINLQYGDTTDDRKHFYEKTGTTIHTLPDIDTLQDIDGLFALIEALDAIVSCSNTTVHIAGALGKPVSAMIPGTRYSLWYWGYAGERTPWYPTVRLYRGPAKTSWRTLTDNVVADITHKKNMPHEPSAD